MHPAWARTARGGLLKGWLPVWGLYHLWALRLALQLASISSWSRFSQMGQPSVCAELEVREEETGIMQIDRARLFRKNPKTREQESPFYSCLWDFEVP